MTLVLTVKQFIKRFARFILEDLEKIWLPLGGTSAEIAMSSDLAKRLFWYIGKYILIKIDIDD